MPPRPWSDWWACLTASHGEILPGVSVRLHDAGHILGSALVELELNEGGVVRRLVYSGDIGQYDTPILHDPAVIEEADCVLMESTYGDRLHRDREETIREIGEIIAAARHDKGNLLIPAFAIGRTQEILYLFGRHYDEWGLGRWQIFLDSPMAIEATASTGTIPSSTTPRPPSFAAG